MSLLATVATRLGRVELHHEDGRFETRGWYVDPDGEQHPSVIPVFAESAREWFDLCAERGAVHADFPDPTPERTSP
jgi:hypothetical protein